MALVASVCMVPLLLIVVSVPLRTYVDISSRLLADVLKVPFTVIAAPAVTVALVLLLVRLLKVVVDDPVIDCAAVPYRFTVPLLLVNILLLENAPLICKVEDGAVTVPAVTVKLPCTSVLLDPNDHAPPLPLNVML